MNGTLGFKPGERAKTVAVSVIGDTILERDETLTVTLSNPINATIANAIATGTITNDDVAPQPLQVLLGTYCGFTTAGGGICFDVAANGTAQYVTRVKYKQTTKNCTPQRKFTLTVTWNGRAPIGPDLRFSYIDTSGGDGEIGSSTQGLFDANGNAQGTLVMKKTFVNQGTQYTCQSTSDWSANKQG